MPITPALAGPRGLTRAQRRSGLLLHWRADEADHTKALSGQALSFTRTSGDAWAVDANGRLVKRAHSAPRYEMVDLDGDGVRESAGLVIEISRTNLVLQCCDFTSGSWTKNQATATSVAGGPDGGNCSLLVESAAASVEHYAVQGVTITAGNYVTVQACVKAKERTKGYLRGWINPDGIYVQFDLATGTVIGSGVQGSGTLIDAGLEPLGDGWWRAWVSGRINAAGTAAQIICELLNAGGQNTYTGDGVSGLYWWGANLQQFSAAGSRIMSPIITAGSTVTRAVETFGGPISWPWQEHLTFYARALAPLWKGATGNAEANGYLLRLGSTAPYVAVYVGGVRDPRCFLDANDGGGTRGNSQTVLTGSSPRLLEICGQVRNLSSAPQARTDAGQGFNAWGTVGAPITAWGAAANFYIGSDGGAQGYGAPIFSGKVAAGLWSLEQMRGAF